MHSLGNNKLSEQSTFNIMKIDRSIILEEESIQMDLKKYVFMNTEKNLHSL